MNTDDCQIPGLASPSETDDGWQWVACNILERLASVAALVALAPLAAVLAVMVAVVSGRTPFVAHRRVGWRGTTLWMLKFRTMWDDAPCRPEELRRRMVERVAEVWVPEKAGGNPRVSHPLARWMRRYSLDELPQLLHVVMGEMALAGPRPLTLEELLEHYGEAAAEVLSVKPGITGLWQVMGRSRLNYLQRLSYDLFLVRNRSLGLYARILLRTLPVVVRGENAC